MSLRSKKVKDLTLSAILIFILYEIIQMIGSNNGQSLDPSMISASSTIYEKNTVKYIPPEVIQYTYNEVIDKDQVNWSQYAYVQYATDWDYLCGLIMNFVKLRRSFNTLADLVLLISKDLRIDLKSPEGKLFTKLVENRGIIVHKVDVIQLKSESTTWNKSFTKFSVFKLTQYKRIIYLDSDSKISDQMDELFFLPDCKIAMPSAYELNYNLYMNKNYDIPLGFHSLSKKDRDTKYRAIYENVHTSDLNEYYLKIYNNLPDLTLTKGFLFENQIMVVKPSMAEYQKLIKLAKHKHNNEYDMDIINKLYNVDTIANKIITPEEELINFIPEVLIIPHMVYGLLSGEFRYSIHDILMADPQDLPYVVSNKLQDRHVGYWSYENWDAMTVYNDIAKLIHFSDFPIPKPWYNQDLPNDYAHLKIICETDVKRLQKYDDYNALQEDEQDHINPTVVSDCDLSNIWNSLYDDYVDERKNICNLDLV